MTYSLATLNIGGKPTPVVKIDAAFYALADVAPSMMAAAPARGHLNVFDDWPRNEQILEDSVDAIQRGAFSVRPLAVDPSADNYLAPLRFPSKVVCMGANYYDHMHQDAGMTSYQKDTVVPTMFVKPAATTMVGSGRSVRYPSQSSKFDWEIELCAIVGKRARKVRAKDAREYIAGFTIGVDLSARDWQLHPKHPFKFDLYGGKAFDDSCPIGPWIVPARYVDDRNLQLRLSVNGNLKQNANTRDMIWPLDEQIEALSMHVTLEPGDVIMTGTPAGVGMKTGTYLKVGDQVEAQIDELGVLQFEIMPDQDWPLIVGRPS